MAHKLNGMLWIGKIVKTCAQGGLLSPQASELNAIVKWVCNMP